MPGGFDKTTSLFREWLEEHGAAFACCALYPCFRPVNSSISFFEKSHNSSASPATTTTRAGVDGRVPWAPECDPSMPPLERDPRKLFDVYTQCAPTRAPVLPTRVHPCYPPALPSLEPTSTHTARSSRRHTKSCAACQASVRRLTVARAALCTAAAVAAVFAVGVAAAATLAAAATATSAGAAGAGVAAAAAVSAAAVSAAGRNAALATSGWALLVRCFFCFLPHSQLPMLGSIPTAFPARLCLCVACPHALSAPALLTRSSVIISASYFSPHTTHPDNATQRRARTTHSRTARRPPRRCCSSRTACTASAGCTSSWSSPTRTTTR